MLLSIITDIYNKCQVFFVCIINFGYYSNNALKYYGFYTKVKPPS